MPAENIHYTQTHTNGAFMVARTSTNTRNSVAIKKLGENYEMP